MDPAVVQRNVGEDHWFLRFVAAIVHVGSHPYQHPVVTEGQAEQGPTTVSLQIKKEAMTTGQANGNVARDVIQIIKKLKK